MTLHTTDMDTLVPQLLARTNELTLAMMQHEAAHLGHAALATRVADIRGGYERSVAANKTYTNAEQRKAAVNGDMAACWSHLLANVDTAEQEKYSAAQNVARAEQEVKTLRTVLMYEAARMELEAAQVAANTMPRLIRSR